MFGRVLYSPNPISLADPLERNVLLLKFLVFLGTLLLLAEPAYAWGPGMHFYLADQLLKMGMVAGTVGTLIKEHDRWFYYGSVIADVVVGKGFMTHEKHSHSWSMVEELRSEAETDDEEAFAVGIWMHLAADTVAHNDYVPDYINRSSFPKKLGHAYWEFRAERWIPDEYWYDIELLIQNDFADHEALLENSIRRTVFPFPVNWALVKSVLKISTWESWRRLGDYYTRMSRHDLSNEEMEPYIELCLERMTHSVAGGEMQDQVTAMDPTGGFH